MPWWEISRVIPGTGYNNLFRIEMNLTGSNAYQNRTPRGKPEDGFTIMEVLVAMAIMSILAVTVWVGFSAAVNLIRAVPGSVELVQGYIAMDTVLREYVSRVMPPFWQPELDYYIDSSSVVFPFYEGEEERSLQIEFYDNHLIISTFSEEEDEDEEIQELYRAGPFSYVYFSEVEEKETGFLGLEITLKPEHPKIDEFTIFARIGGHIFEKP
jgi:prepilin-type N-terminal cleavage/methylation domain-containing protein